MFTNGGRQDEPAGAPGDFSSVYQAVQGLLTFLCEYEKRISELEQKTEERQRPKPKVVRTHKAMVRQVYGGKCPCCMKRMEDPQVDHFSSRAWPRSHRGRLEALQTLQTLQTFQTLF